MGTIGIFSGRNLVVNQTLGDGAMPANKIPVLPLAWHQNSQFPGNQIDVRSPQSNYLKNQLVHSDSVEGLAQKQSDFQTQRQRYEGVYLEL